MSALGQKQTLRLVRLMSALPPKADVALGPRDARSTPRKRRSGVGSVQAQRT